MSAPVLDVMTFLCKEEACCLGLLLEAQEASLARNAILLAGNTGLPGQIQLDGSGKKESPW